MPVWKRSEISPEPLSSGEILPRCVIVNVPGRKGVDALKIRQLI
jgi:hypothetical protein